MRWASFIHVRRTVNVLAPVPNRNRCSIFALPDPNWWMATSGWLARPYGYSGMMGNVPEAMISGTVMLPIWSDIYSPCGVDRRHHVRLERDNRGESLVVGVGRVRPGDRRDQRAEIAGLLVVAPRDRKSTRLNSS